MGETIESIDGVAKETNDIMENNVNESFSKKSKKNNYFKSKKCEVIFFNKKTGDLDINFDGYGIRIHNVQNFEGSTVEIKYKGDIGKPNFVCRM